MYEAFKEATAVVEGMSNRVNKRVMQMYDKASQEYSELSKKKATVEQDKHKIETVCGGVFVFVHLSARKRCVMCMG